MPTENVTSLKMELGPNDLATPTSLTAGSCAGFAIGAPTSPAAPFFFSALTPLEAELLRRVACARSDAWGLAPTRVQISPCQVGPG